MPLPKLDCTICDNDDTTIGHFHARTNECLDNVQPFNSSTLSSTPTSTIESLPPFRPTINTMSFVTTHSVGNINLTTTSNKIKSKENPIVNPTPVMTTQSSTIRGNNSTNIFSNIEERVQSRRFDFDVATTTVGVWDIETHDDNANERIADKGTCHRKRKDVDNDSERKIGEWKNDYDEETIKKSNKCRHRPCRNTRAMVDKEFQQSRGHLETTTNKSNEPTTQINTALAELCQENAVLQNLLEQVENAVSRAYQAIVNRRQLMMLLTAATNSTTSAPLNSEELGTSHHSNNLDDLFDMLQLVETLQVLLKQAIEKSAVCRGHTASIDTKSNNDGKQHQTYTNDLSSSESGLPNINNRWNNVMETRSGSDRNANSNNSINSGDLVTSVTKQTLLVCLACLEENRLWLEGTISTHLQWVQTRLLHINQPYSAHQSKSTLLDGCSNLPFHGPLNTTQGPSANANIIMPLPPPTLIEMLQNGDLAEGLMLPSIPAMLDAAPQSSATRNTNPTNANLQSGMQISIPMTTTVPITRHGSGRTSSMASLNIRPTLLTSLMTGPSESSLWPNHINQNYSTATIPTSMNQASTDNNNEYSITVSANSNMEHSVASLGIDQVLFYSVEQQRRHT